MSFGVLTLVRPQRLSHGSGGVTTLRHYADPVPRSTGELLPTSYSGPQDPQSRAAKAYTRDPVRPELGHDLIMATIAGR